MPHEPPAKQQCFTTAGEAGLAELRKPSANLGLRAGLDALGRILDPARPCFRGLLGTNSLAYSSSAAMCGTCYGTAAPGVASAPVLTEGVGVEQQRAWKASMPVRFELVFGAILRSYVDGWHVLFRKLESKGYCNDVETQYERGIDALRHQAAPLWDAVWARELAELQLPPTPGGEAVFQTMAMAWPDAMMLLAHGSVELDWTSPTQAEIERDLAPAELERGAYTFGWAVLRAVEHVADRLQQQRGEPDPIDLRAAAALDSVRLTVSQAKAAPRSANLSLVNELDRATTERGGLFRLSPLGQTAMRQISGHFQKWLTFDRMGKTRHKFSLLTEVISKIKAAPSVRAAVMAMLPPEDRGPDCDAVTTKLLADLLASYSKMEGKSFASDLNDRLAARLQNAVALRKQVKMAALRRTLMTPEQREVEATAKAEVKARKQQAAAAARDEAKRQTQEASRKRKQQEALAAVEEGGWLALDSKHLDVKKLKLLVRSFGVERVPGKKAELLQLYEAFKPTSGPRRSNRGQ